MLCPVHNKELKYGKGGSPYCPTPISKSADGKTVLEWCKYKPGFEDAPAFPPHSDKDMPPPMKQSFGEANNPFPWDESLEKQPAPFVPRDYVWEGHVKGLNNLAGSMLTNGKSPEEVWLALESLKKIVLAIDKLAK